MVHMWNPMAGWRIARLAFCFFVGACAHTPSQWDGNQTGCMAELGHVPALAEMCAENQRAAQERVEKRWAGIPDEVAKALDAGRKRVSGFSIEKDDWKDYPALEACRDSAPKRGEDGRDWAWEEDCFLLRTEEDFAKFAKDWDKIARHSARYVCAELTKVRRERMERHWLEGPLRDTLMEERTFEECYGFRSEWAVDDLTEDTPERREDIKDGADGLISSCSPACVQPSVNLDGKVQAPPTRVDVVAGCLRLENAGTVLDPLVADALPHALKRGLDEKTAKQCIGSALSYWSEHDRRAVFDLCYLSETDTRFSSLRGKSFRNAELGAYSSCMEYGGYDRTLCLQTDLRYAEASCGKVAGLDNDLLSRSRFYLAEDICESVAPHGWGNEASPEFAAKAFELCIDEQMSLFQQ